MATYLITGVTLGDTSVASDGVRVTNSANAATTFGIDPGQVGLVRVGSGENGASVIIDLTGDYTPVPGSSLSMALSGAPMLLATLADQSRMGAVGVANAAQASYPAGIASLGFGPSTRVNFGGGGNNVTLDLTGDYTAPGGINVGLYLDGNPLVGHATIGATSLFGTADVESPLSARPVGFDSLSFLPKLRVNRGENGASVLLDLSGAYASPAGTSLSMPLSGSPLVLGSLGETLKIGTATLQNAAQAAYPVGFDATRYGAKSHVTPDLDARRLALELSGNYSPPNASAIQMVWAGSDKSVSPESIDSLNIGAANLVNVSQGAFTQGFDASTVGLPKIAQTFPITPGTDFARYGNAHVELLLTKTKPAGFSASLFGKPWVVYFLRQIRPEGFKRDAYGKPAMQGGVRDAPVSGFNALGVGRPNVTLGSRQVYPTWFVDTRYGKPMMGYDRTFSMTGFDATKWGATLVWDNTQRAYPRGLDATRFGTAWADRYTRSIGPKRFVDGDQENIGFPNLYNLNRYITVNYIADQWNEGGMGAYQSLFVKNVNREVDLVRNGIAPPFRQVPLGHQVLNGARQVRAHGFDAVRWGERKAVGGTFIAPRIRYLQGHGFKPIELSSRFHIVRNGAFAPVPTGWDSARVGRPPLVENTRRYFDHFKVGQTDAWGMPFIAPRVRSVGPQNPLEPVRGLVGGATVWFLNRDVTPAQPSFGWGSFGKVIVTGYPIPNARVKSIPPTWQWGTARVWNRTPEVTPYWETRLFTQFGNNAIFNRNNYFPIEGLSLLRFGDNTIITYRTKQVGKRGFDALRFNPKHTIRNVLPDPPGQQYAIGCTLGKTGRIGDVQFKNLALWPVGIDSDSYGTAKLQGMSIFPKGIPPFISDNGTQFGMPDIPGQQHITVPSMPTDTKFSGYFGKPRMTPWTIWAPSGAPDQAKNNNPGRDQIIDQTLDDKYGYGHPWFGWPRVELKNRIVYQRRNSVNERFGQPKLSRNPQYAKPDGPRLTKYGYPHLLGGNRAVLAAGFDLSSVGAPTLTAVEPFIRYVYPKDTDFARIGSAWAANFIRYPGVRGIDSDAWGRAWIHPPPPPAYPPGLDATLWGEKRPTDGMFIAYRIRHLGMTGFDAFVSDYSLGWFDERMRVLGRSVPRDVSLGDQSTVGKPALNAKDRAIVVNGIVPSSRPVPAPAMRQQNRVNLVSLGRLTSWGEPWALAAQEGSVQPRGEDFAAVGWPTTSRDIRVPGLVGNLGSARTAKPASIPGIPAAGFGQTVLMGFGCGRQVRAIIGYDSSTFGEVTVNGVSP